MKDTHIHTDIYIYILTYTQPYETHIYIYIYTQQQPYEKKHTQEKGFERLFETVDDLALDAPRHVPAFIYIHTYMYVCVCIYNIYIHTLTYACLVSVYS